MAVDMSMVAGSDNAGPFNPGDPFNYVIDVTNNNPTLFSVGPVRVQVTSTDVAIGMPVAGNWFCVIITNGLECEYNALVIPRAAGPAGFVSFPPNTTDQLVLPSQAPNVAGTFTTLVNLAPVADAVIGANPQMVVLGVAPQDASLQVTGSAPATAPAGSTITYNYQITNYDNLANPLDGKDSTSIGLDVLFDEVPFNANSTAQGLGFSGSGWSCSISRRGPSRADPPTRGVVAVSYFCNWTGTLSLGQSTSMLQLSVQAPGMAGVDFEASAFPFGTDYAPTTGDELFLVTGITQVQDADLFLEKTVSEPAVMVGEQYTYALTVENLGPGTATGFSVNDMLPSGVTVDGFQGVDWTCFAASATNISCDYGGPGLAAGELSTVRLLVTAPNSAGTLVNDARVISSSDMNPDNDNSSVPVQIVTEQTADLSITKESIPLSVIPGGTIDYLLTITNNSDFDVPDVEVVDTLPDGVSGVIANGTGWNCTVNATTATCLNPTLPALSSSTILITVTAPDVEGTLVNSATVDSIISEANPADNQASALTEVRSGIDLSISKTADRSVAAVGDMVVFDILVSNAGPSDATGVSVTDDLPIGFDLDTVTANGWSCIILTRQVGCDLLDPLPAGGMASITLSGSVSAAPGASLMNTASVSAQEPDLNGSDNSASATVTINEGGGGSGQPADLVLTVTDSEDPVLTGDPFSYTLNVQNAGPAGVNAFNLNASLSNGLRVDGVTAQSSGLICSADVHQVSCVFTGSLDPGDQVSAAVDVTAPDQAGSGSLSASLEILFQDPDLSSNMAVETTEIRVTPTEDQLRDALNNALGNSNDPLVRDNLDPLAELCGNPTTPTLIALCREIADALDDGRGDEVAEAIRQTVGRQTITQHTSLIEAGAAQLANVVARLREIRGGGGGGTLSIAGLNLRIGNQNLPIGLLQGAFEEQEAEIDSQGLVKPWGFFINGTIGGGDRDNTAREIGFDFDTLGVTAGIDYRTSLNGVIGAAIGYSDFESDFIDGSTLTTDGLTLSFYGSYYPTDSFYVDGRLSYGNMDFEQRRLIQFTIGDLVIDDVALGQTEADHWSGAFSLGWIINSGNWNFSPSANVSVFQADIDPFSETGSELALNFQAQEVDSLIASASLSLSRIFSLSRGVLTPQLDLAFHHEAKNDESAISSRLVNAAGGSPFFIDADAPDSNYASAAIGLVYVGANGRQAYLSYREILGLSGFSRWTVNAGVRFEF